MLQDAAGTVNAPLRSPIRVGASLRFPGGAVKLCCFHFPRESGPMLLSRDFVAYISTEVVKRLAAEEMIETRSADAVTQRIRLRMQEELGVEERLNEEVRQILLQHQDEMRRTGASYQEMYKKVKAQLARDRRLILR